MDQAAPIGVRALRSAFKRVVANLLLKRTWRGGQGMADTESADMGAAGCRRNQHDRERANADTDQNSLP